MQARRTTNRSALYLGLLLGGCRGQDVTGPAAPPGEAPAAKASTIPASATPPAGPALATAANVASAGAKVWSFDADAPDVAPSGFSFARTGAGKEGRWTVKAVADAPSKGNVLVQLDADPTDDRFPLAVVEGSSFQDVRLAVSCRPLSGGVDRACGLVWRYRDAKNYYLTRANALEDNVRLYAVKDGHRVQLASWNGKVAAGVWHRLAVDARGDRFEVSFDDRKVLDAKDASFADAGKVGVWTKADSVTQFDDLAASAP